jgi:manganese/iron transport system substrate-binding protein
LSRMILDNKRRYFLFIPIIIFGLAACAQSNESLRSAGTGRPPTMRGAASSKDVIATTTILAALVQTVAQGKFRVRALVPAGVSPETYEPKPRDLVSLEHAALLVENGAGLEAWLQKILSSAGSPNLQVLVLSDGLSPSVRATSNLYANPHYWLDPVFAQTYVEEISAALSRLDPANATEYRSKAGKEISRLQALDAWIRRQVATIPPQNRAMITYHDAWYYFDRRYGIRDLGSIVSSPGKDPSAAEFAALIAKARANHVRAVFAEPEFSPKLINQLASSAHIRTVTDLYDDSLGQTPQLSTYEGVMRYDVTAIVDALKNG